MTMTRNSCIRSARLFVWCLWLTAACVAAGRAPRVPRHLTAPRGPVARVEEAPGAAAGVDRSLHIRSIPALNGYTSNLFEVFMHPYQFEVPALTAVAALMGAGEAEAGGELMLWQPEPPFGPLIVAGNLTGLPAGAKLLLQVKRWGDTRSGCDATGPPYDPFAPAMVSSVGIPGLLAPPPPRFLGDVGVVEVADDGGARVHMVTHALGLSGTHSVLGRALALRTLPMPPAGGKGGDGDAPAAQKNDDKMEAIACGVIALTKYQPLPPPPPPPMPPPPPKNPDAEAVEAESLNTP